MIAQSTYEGFTFLDHSAERIVSKSLSGECYPNPPLVKDGFITYNKRERRDMSEIDTKLDHVTKLTKDIRAHQVGIVQTSKRRRSAVLWLREKGVPYKEIATAMNTTEQTVYKIIRGDL